MNVVIDNGFPDDEMFAIGDNVDGHEDAEALDVELFLLDHDVLHIVDVLS